MKSKKIIENSRILEILQNHRKSLEIEEILWKIIKNILFFCFLQILEIIRNPMKSKKIIEIIEILKII